MEVGHLLTVKGRLRLSLGISVSAHLEYNYVALLIQELHSSIYLSFKHKLSTDFS